MFSRYLAKEFLKINLSMIMLFIMLYCVIDFLDQNTRYFPKYKATAPVILEYYASQVPKMVVDILPFSMLFSSIIVLWVFSRSGEIAAVRAAGRSVFRSCSPLITVGLIMSVISFLLSEFVVPPATRHRMRVESVKIQKEKYEEIFYESRWIRGQDSALHFKIMDPVYSSLNDVEYFEFGPKQQIRRFTYATRAVFDAKLKHWVLEQAVDNRFTPNGEVSITEYLQKMPTTVAYHPPRLLREEVTSDQVSFRDLRQLIRHSIKTGGSLASREVDLQQKLSMPFANVLLVFLALPFAIRKERQADTYLLVILCLVAAIIYWLGNASMRNLAIGGSLHPVAAAWITNLVLLALSLFIISKLEKGT